MKYNRFISLSLFIFSGILLLCTVFATNSRLEDGLVTGKVHWFHLAMLFMTMCSLVAVVLTKPEGWFRFSFVDVLVLFLVTTVILTYNWQLNPEPEKMLFGGQLVVLWFLLRFIFAEWQQLRLFFIAMIIGTGLIEAISGVRQLHGFDESNHSLFNLTGDFYNPGPYSGYLALILPLCLWVILEFGKYKKAGWRQTKIYLYYLAGVCLLAIIVILPAGMSRTAWIAAAISCGWVYWVQRIGWEKTKKYIYENQTLSIVSSLLILISIVSALVGIYALKKDSANGRLLLWKIMRRAIMEHPLTGTGLGGFPTAYAEAQAVYFASGEASETEVMVAGCPDYGFNEFLQIGLEQGIVGLMFFLLLLSYSLYQGMKNRQIGAVGGILSLIVFSLASYPLQLPEFWVVLVVFMGVINTPIDADRSSVHTEKGRIILSMVMIGGLAMCCGGIFWQQKRYYEGYKKWNMLKMLHNNKAYEAASEGYEKLVPLMRHRPEFLFETALCLNRTKRYAEANTLLYQAMKLSNDPMIHYVAAKNEQSMGNYQKAEDLLLHAINILPERIYPYYLLTKLYSEPVFFQKDKFINAAKAVLAKEPKVESVATREMREEVKMLIQSRLAVDTQMGIRQIK